MRKNLTRQRQSGFSMVELVVVILIIACLSVAVYAGGSNVVTKSRDSRVESDFHNYSVAAESYMTSNKQILKLNNDSSKDDIQPILLGFNGCLGSSFTVNPDKVAPADGAIRNTNSDVVAFESEKLDPWGNPYYVLFDGGSRSTEDSSAYITVFSAGKNGQGDIGGTLDSDDEFLLCQYSNGAVITKSYSMANDSEDASGQPLVPGFTSLVPSSGTAPMNKLAVNLSSSTGSGSSSSGSGSSGSGSGSTSGAGSSSVGSSCAHHFSHETVKKATCSEAGEVKYTCTKCGAFYTKKSALAAHSLVAETVASEPTCIAVGKMTQTCSVCGYVKETELPKVAHKFDEKTGICSVCHELDPDNPNAGRISFTFFNETYYAEKGMTWSEWVNSSYNTTYEDNYVTMEEYIAEYSKTSGSSFSYKDTDWLSAFVQYKTVKNATHVLKDGAIFIYSGSKAVTCSGLHFYDANGNLLHRERYALYNSSYGDFKLAKNGSVVQYASDKIEDGATYSMKYDD